MDGAFYRDSRPPFDIGATPPAAVTLATTNKALYTASEFAAFGSGYWWLGKRLNIRLWGKATTGATPGNGQFAIYWGTGADANGTIIQQSTAVAMAANQSNISWWIDLIIECTVRGSSGKLFCMGAAYLNALLSTNVPIPIPASSPATSSAIDLTAGNVLSVQFNRSGNTAESMQVLLMDVSPCN